MKEMSAERAAKLIRRTAMESQDEVELAATKMKFKPPKGIRVLDLGFKKDFYDFARQLDEEMIGVSRIEFSKPRPKKVVGGMNQSYYVFMQDGGRKIVHVIFYSKSGNEGLDWKVRGHEEGHIVDNIGLSLNEVSAFFGCQFKRYDSNTFPSEFSRHAIKTRNIDKDEVNTYENSIEVESEDNFRVPFGIVPENRPERKILRSSVYATGANITRRSAKNKIGEHVKQVLNYIDAQDYERENRKKLRLIAMYHDLGKQVTYNSQVPGNQHGKISGDIARDFGVDERVARVIDTHDYPYYLFRRYAGSKRKGDAAAETHLVEGLRNVNLDLLIKFAEADENGRETQAVKWFESNLGKWGLKRY